ncbi:hypothetical protein [Candidatus Lokiarchaeum ossiferum]|uniref:hypothetical protein n=1 Tax=Candidatus Lokiarchaeum ossiferum TaxID=2951803 RepID=UPI00352FE6E1
MAEQEVRYMKKSSLRNLLSVATMIACNAIFLLTQQSRFASIGDEIGSFAAIIAAATVISGFLGGLIAPYTYRKVVLYMEIFVAIGVLVGGIILFSLGQAIGGTDNPFAELAIILLIVILVVAILIFGIVSSIGFFLGAFIGSKVGKSFTSNYTLENEDATKFGDSPFQSQM